MNIGYTRWFEKHIIAVDSSHGPLLIRYILFRVPSFGIYVHKLLRDDNDRALHDHPWSFISIIIKGSYAEWTPEFDNTMVFGDADKQKCRIYRAGSILKRPAEFRHRFALVDKPTWTLVFVGPRVRRWGFWINGVDWCWWRKYNNNTGVCEDEIRYTGGRD